MGSGARALTLLRYALFGCALSACGGEANGDERPSPASGGSPGTSVCDGVRFDPAVEAAVRMDLQKPSGELSLADLGEVRSVRAQGASSLAGLECFTHLEYLVANGGTFADLSPLAGLQDLLVVSVIGSEVRSLAPLAGLPRLETVGFSHGFVSDLTPLAAIPNLKWVSIYGEVSDVSPLANLPNLEILELYGNPLSDVSALGSLPALTRLKLDSTLVTSVDIDAPALEDFSAADTPLSDVSTFGRFVALTKFVAPRSLIEDISQLGELPQLRNVDLTRTRVHDLSPLLRTPVTYSDCAPLSATETPLDEPLASEVVPKLCAMGWAVWTGAKPGAGETCRPDCIHSFPP